MPGSATPCCTQPPVKQLAGSVQRISMIVPSGTPSTRRAAEPSGCLSNEPFSGPCTQMFSASAGAPSGTVSVAVSVPMSEMPDVPVRFQENSPTSP